MYNVVTLFYFTAWAFSYTDWFSLKSILFKFFLLDCNQRYQREWEYCKPSQPDCLLWHDSCSELIFSVWYLSGFPSNTVSVNTWYIFNKCWHKKNAQSKNFLPSMDSSNFLYLSSYPFFLGLVLMISRYPSLQYIVYFNDKIISIKSIFSTSFNILQLFSTFIQTEDNTNNAKPQFIDSILLL